MTRELRVAHVITGLGAGGAEAMLVKLVAALEGRGFTQQVVSLMDGGVNEDRLRALGVPVRSLGMKKGVPDPRAVVRLARWLHRARPDLVQTWMYQADVLGGLASRALPTSPVVWNVQNSTLPPRPKPSIRAAVGLSAVLSRRIPTRIVVCSEAGLEHHVELGYPRERMVLVENGIDLERFQPNANARAKLRAELNVTDDDVLIALPARFAPEKDHDTFLNAVRLVRERHPSVRAVLCGEGTGPSNPALDRLAHRHGLPEGALLRLGRRDDMEQLLSAFDIVCLSSSHVEAFSNALGEAMAVGAACASTDVGDSARMLGDDSLVAPPREPRALAAVLERLVALGPEGRGEVGGRLRRRMEERFSLARTVERYEDLYRELLVAPR